MRRILRIGTAFAVALVMCSGALAQPRGRHSAPITVSTPGGMRLNSAAHPLAFSSRTNSGAFGGLVFNSFVPVSVETLLTGSFPVPGLGFDFAHFAAVNRNLAVRALIDPSTQFQLSLARQIRRETPIFPIGAPFFAPSTPVIIVQQPPVVIVQQPPAQEEIEARTKQVRYTEPEVKPEPVSPAEPVRELPEFVLVRRDGTLVSAVAFTRHRDQIVYITREGIRRSLLLADLDVDATLLLNEEFGTTLRLSNFVPERDGKSETKR